MNGWIGRGKAVAAMMMLAAVTGVAVAQAPSVQGFAQREEATLEELLTNGLKVRTAAEKAFIAKVVKVVEEGKLSESLVKALFQRARAQHERYPLPYFTAMIQRVAKQHGVEL